MLPLLTQFTLRSRDSEFLLGAAWTMTRLRGPILVQPVSLGRTKT